MSNFDTRSSGCTDVELINNTTLRITSTGLYSGYSVSGTFEGVPNGGINVVSGNPSTVGVLKFNITGDLDKIDLDQSSFRFYYQFGDTAIQQQVLSFTEILEPHFCEHYLPGEILLNVKDFNIVSNDSWIDGEPVELAISYDYLPSTDVITAEITVPDASKVGNDFIYKLPLGNVHFKSSAAGFYIGLENNTNNPSQIDIVKEEGLINVMNEFAFNVQESSLSTRQHQVNFKLSNVDICLGEHEVFLDSATTISLDNANLIYPSRRACLMIEEGGILQIPDGGFQRIGNNGVGVQGWKKNSYTEVGENATLILDNTFFASFFSPEVSFFDVYAGGHVEVTAQTVLQLSGLGTAWPRDIYHVTLHEDATFDMSAAPLEVRRLFVINGVSNNKDVLQSSDYTVFPNPVEDGVVKIQTSPSVKALQRIEVLDLAGCTISSQAALAGAAPQTVELPTRGIFVLRLTEVDGRVGHTKVISQ